MHSEVTMTYRGITLRVHPGSRHKHDKMMRTTGACRRVWNEVLEICKRQWQDYLDGQADKPSVAYPALLRSGRGQLERFMAYKTHTDKIDPKYTSQLCSHCGVVRKANRKSQSVYHCSECGMDKNADVNAAVNIRDKGLAKIAVFGDDASAGGGSVDLPRPMKPEQVLTESPWGSFYIVTL